MPQGFTAERFEALANQERAHLFIILHIAALSSVISYP